MAQGGGIESATGRNQARKTFDRAQGRTQIMGDAVGEELLFALQRLHRVLALGQALLQLGDVRSRCSWSG